MATVQSVFGKYADKLQFMIDKRLDAFAAPWFSQYFDIDTPSMSLTYSMAIGRSRVEAAATVVTRGSQSPVRGRGSLEVYNGEVVPILVKYPMDEKVLRDYMMLQNSPVSDEVKKNAALKLLFDDVKRSGDASLMRVDAMVLEGMSTGKITLTTTNNPDGQVTPVEVDLLMAADQKTNAATVWSNTSSTPITDINTVVNNGRPKGKVFAKILMTFTAWNYFIKTTDVKDLFGAYLGKSNNKVIPTLDTVNEMMQGLRLPIIELVEKPIGIEKNGVISTIYPFADASAVFIPAGKLGTIKNALAAEQMKPVGNISYGTFNNVLISKWQENEPWAEWTKSEFNAFPAFDAIDGVHILTVTGF